MLFKKNSELCQRTGAESHSSGGRGAANSDLRRRFSELSERYLSGLSTAPLLCTDNAAMVASAAFFSGVPAPLSIGAYSRGARFRLLDCFLRGNHAMEIAIFLWC
ncbi:MAG: hypothetical protein IPM93_23985 [Candidatus Obscuribacter sp.]|nr:hypothetical protein [Candidatus Obscuribacter sp.]